MPCLLSPLLVNSCELLWKTLPNGLTRLPAAHPPKRAAPGISPASALQRPDALAPARRPHSRCRTAAADRPRKRRAPTAPALAVPARKVPRTSPDTQQTRHHPPVARLPLRPLASKPLKLHLLGPFKLQGTVHE
jgi:hypothetical protein